jgi:hypothetical protein
VPAASDTATAPNRVRLLRFTDAATLTHNAASLALPGGANLVTAAGAAGIQDIGRGRAGHRLAGGAGIVDHPPGARRMPGGANLVTAAGDTAVAVSDAAGTWRVVDYARASGNARLAALWVRVAASVKRRSRTRLGAVPKLVTVPETWAGSGRCGSCSPARAR